MTVTKDQAQMLTTLAIACRPHRAPTWDPAGVMAAISAVRDRSLAEVILAVIRAASDRDAQTPGVIPSNGTHWQEQLKPPPFQPSTWDPAAVCTTCSRQEAQCRSVRHGDDKHPFVSRAVNAQQTERPAEAVALIVAELKERLGAS
jgi:hypothetical protein